MDWYVFLKFLLEFVLSFHYLNYSIFWEAEVLLASIQPGKTTV